MFLFSIRVKIFLKARICIGDMMKFFFNSLDDNEDIDFESLRTDLIDEYGCQMASFSGGLGFCDMCDAEDASDEELLTMAKREGIDLRKYRK